MHTKKKYPQKVADDERKWPSVITKLKDRITTAQAVVIIVNYILGTGILTLPRASVEKVKTPDVWLSVILGGILAMVSGVIMVKLSQQFPEKTFYQYSQDIVGKWIGRLLSFLIIGYFLTTSAFQIRSMAEVISFFFARRNPHMGYCYAFYVDRSLFDYEWY